MGFGCPHPGVIQRKMKSEKISKSNKFAVAGYEPFAMLLLHLSYHVTNGIEVMYHFFVLFVQFIRYYIYFHFTFKKKKLKMIEFDKFIS